MRVLKVKITGTGPLLMHNSQLANPFNKFAQRLAELNVQKKKKGVDKLEILREMADTEWEGGLYYDDKLGPYVPAEMIRATLIGGARLTRGGKTVERAVFIPKARFKLNYKGPRKLADLRKDENFRDQRMVRVGQVMVLRTRPMFEEWSVEVEIGYNEKAIDGEIIRRYLEDAGAFEGFGDGRSLGFGRFEHKEISETVLAQPGSKKDKTPDNGVGDVAQA